MGKHLPKQRDRFYDEKCPVCGFRGSLEEVDAGHEIISCSKCHTTLTIVEKTWFKEVRIKDQLVWKEIGYIPENNKSPFDFRNNPAKPYKKVFGFY